MRLRFQPQDRHPPSMGSVRRIRLVNRDDKGASLQPESIEIL